MEKLIKKIINHLRKCKVTYLLIIIILYFISSNIIWLIKDNSPTRWDDSWNLLGSNYYYRTFIREENRSTYELTKVFSFFGVASSFPPFFKISSVPLYLLFGFSPDIGIATNLIYYLILVFSIFILTKRLVNKNAALFAVFLVSTMPLLVGLSRIYLLDFALTSMLIAGFVTFIYTQNFKHRAYSILFAIIFGLGSLTKIQYPVLLLPSIIFLLILDLKKRRWTISQSRNLLITCFIIGIALISWISKYSTYIINYIKMNTSRDWKKLQGDPIWNSWDGITHYIIQTSNGISFIYYVLFTIALILIIYFLLKNKNFNSEKNSIVTALLLFIVWTTALFTYIANKDQRFIVPIFPAIAIITSVGLWKIRFKQKIAPIIILLIISFGLFQIHSYTSGYKLFGKYIMIGELHVLSNYNQYLVPPSKQDWKIEDILFLIKEDAGVSKISRPSVAIYSDIQQFNPVNFQMYAYANSIPIGYLRMGSRDYKKYDYIIIKTDEVRIEWLKEIREKIIKDKNLEEVKVFSLPDKSSAKIYKKKEISY